MRNDGAGDVLMANTQLWTADRDTPFDLAGRRIDPAQRQITYSGKTTVVEPRVMSLLMRLAESPHQPVRRDALMDAVWPGSPGAESSLSNAISLLRQALNDQGGAPAERLIKTVPKIGYCLTAEPVDVTAPPVGKRETRWFAAIAVLAVALIGVFVFWPKPSADGIDPSSTANDRLFVVVAPITADDSYRALAHTLVRDATTLLERSTAYRVADQSEAYQVMSGSLSADLVIAASIETRDNGLRLRATWAREGATTDAIRDIGVAPGAVLALREQWLEAVAVETALALQPAGTPSSAALENADTDVDIELPATTANAEAFEAYSNGLYLASQYRADLMLEAIDNLERAVGLDPDFALAWAHLGSALMQAGSHQGALTAGATRLRARDALLKAVTLQPDLALAYDALGDYYNCVAREPILAQRAFDQLFQIAPDFTSPAYTRLLLLHYPRERAIARINKNIERYPDSVTWRVIAAQHMLAAGEMQRALQLAEDALAIAPALAESQLTTARIRSTLGQHEAALAMLDELAARTPDSARIAAHQVMALAHAGSTDQAIQLRDSALTEARGAKATHRAMAYAWTDDSDAAFEALDQALGEREFGLCYVATEPVYAPLRDDPRFDRVVQTMRGAELN
ncbi:MAG: winged helix-turn-helix domain-containing protein [Pseudomonadota bacterium]